MRNGWGMWVCGVVLGAAAGFVCGHVAAWSRVEKHSDDHAVPFQAEAAANITPPEAEFDDGPVYFPDRVAPPLAQNDGDEMMHADAVLGTGQAHPAAVSEPAALPEPADAAPLSEAEQHTLGALLDSALEDLAPADREIWLDALEGMQPEDALGVVRIWKQFGGGPGLLADTHTADAPAQTKIPSILLPAPNTPAPFSRAPSPRKKLRDARQIVIHNLLNAETYGYRRIEPAFGISSPFSPGQPTSAGANAGVDRPALQMAQSRIDHSPGRLVETVSPFDLAIEGNGFFVVRAPDEGQLFTRCGRFSRNPEGRLVLKTSHGELPVEPKISIPRDSVALKVSIDGEVSIARDGGPPEAVGVLTLALFVAPAQLATQSDALFAETERSGAPQIGEPNEGGRGVILQRRLEQSNVSVVAATSQLQRIDEWLELIDDVASEESAKTGL